MRPVTAGIILAAGQGTRLRPLTDDRPKCLVPYQGRPILEHLVACFHRCGIFDLTLVTGYAAERLQDLGFAARHNPRFASTNMTHSLFCARDTLLKGAVICYGDIVFRPGVLEALLQDPHPLAVTVDLRWRELWERRFADPLADAETLRMAPDGRILEIGGRPRCFADIQAQYMGLIKMSAKTARKAAAVHDGLDRQALYDGQPFERMYMTSFLQALIDRGLDVHAVPVSGGWVEIDSPSDLRIEFVE